MSHAIRFELHRTPFNEHYTPADSTRLTTNFANLARGQDRQSNLRRAIAMIDNRFNQLAHWDNPEGSRYQVSLDIISVDIYLNDDTTPFPFVEMLETRIHDKVLNKTYQGLVGNSFSSYVRDYDFSIVLPAYNKDKSQFSLPPGYGDLHGKLFKAFLASSVYQAHFAKAPVICLSVSTNKVYRRVDNRHPVLGVEYVQNEDSLTDAYFAKMGLQVRYFQPEGSVAPFAFYFAGDVCNDFTPLELIATIATMESFQKIYRPEIYNANAAAPAVFRPSLSYQDYAPTLVAYDRVERSQLAVQQGQFAQTHFVEPHQAELDAWAAQFQAD